MAQSWEAIKRLAAQCEPKNVLVVGPTDTTLELALLEVAPSVRVFFTEHLEHELAPTEVDPGSLLRPPTDRKLQQVEHEVEDLHYVLPYLGQRRVAVQAGGAYGLWPLRLAELFEVVYTFEPVPSNFDLLVANTAGHDNIIRLQAALADGPGMVDMKLDNSHRDNAGAAYAVPVEEPGAPAVALDHLGLQQVDLIWLDIEGYEALALKGGQRLIDRWRPVVVIECKPLPHKPHADPFAPVRWLEKRGYSRVRDLHRDVLMVPNDRTLPERAPDADEPELFDLVHIGVHGSEDEVSSAISRGYRRLAADGWITGTHFSHRSIDVQRAIANHFNLLHVACAEGAVWMFQKPIL